MEHRAVEHQGRGVSGRVRIEAKFLTLADGRRRLPGAGVQAGYQLLDVGAFGTRVGWRLLEGIHDDTAESRSQTRPQVTGLSKRSSATTFFPTATATPVAPST